MAPAGQETTEVRGKGEAAEIKGPAGSRAPPPPHFPMSLRFVLGCQACDLNLERPFWGGQITDAEVFYQSAEASR